MSSLTFSGAWLSQKQKYWESACLNHIRKARFLVGGIYQSLEALVIKACKQEELEEDLDAICTFYQDDFDKGIFRFRLQTLVCQNIALE